MASLEKIPSPVSHHWREFRVKVMPPVVFLATGILVYLLWTGRSPAPTLVGEVEAIQSNISSSQAGVLAEVTVERFQKVQSGQPLAKVITTGPKVLAATLGVIKAEIELLRVGKDPVLNKVRNEINHEQLTFDWMLQRIELAKAKVELQFAENTLKRYAQMHGEKVISEDDLEAARLLQQSLQAQVTELTKVVDGFKIRLDRTKPDEGQPQDPAQDPVRAAIAVEEQKLRLTEAQLSPEVLTCPVNGMVTRLLRHSGENVAAGEPIMVISSSQSDKIVAYVLQPLRIEPKVGMKVLVSTRGLGRQSQESEIIEVGMEMELVSTPLRVRGLGASMERGLPFMVSLPPNLKVRPGELVDLLLLSAR